MRFESRKPRGSNLQEELKQFPIEIFVFETASSSSRLIVESSMTLRFSGEDLRCWQISNSRSQEGRYEHTLYDYGLSVRATRFKNRWSSYESIRSTLIPDNHLT